MKTTLASQLFKHYYDINGHTIESLFFLVLSLNHFDRCNFRKKKKWVKEMYNIEL